MKISLAIVLPKRGIGGGYRKYLSYFENFDRRLCDVQLIALDKESVPTSDFASALTLKQVKLMPESKLIPFVKEKKIDFVYCGGSISDLVKSELEKTSFLLYNVNFLPNYELSSNSFYFSISQTLYYKMQLAKNSLVNQTRVVYNPIPVSEWEMLSKANTADSKARVLDGKIVVGRIARAQPSKWDPLIISTLRELDRRSDTKCKFVFAGMPLLYRKLLWLSLSKKYFSKITFLPELTDKKDIAKFYSSIDVFWQCSQAGETFGNAMVEAYCFDKPVVADCKHFVSDSGKLMAQVDNSQLEIVDDKSTGRILFDSISIADYFETVEHSELDKMGVAGHKKAISSYSAKASCNALLKHLYLILRERKGFSKITAFESLAEFPKHSDVKSFGQEYKSRLRAVGFEHSVATSKLFSADWFLSPLVFGVVSYSYLVKRKLLSYIGVSVESISWFTGRGKL